MDLGPFSFTRSGNLLTDFQLCSHDKIILKCNELLDDVILLIHKMEYFYAKYALMYYSFEMSKLISQNVFLKSII